MRINELDCVKTLHMIMRDPDELKRAQADFAAAWSKAIAMKNKPRQERFTATGEAVKRISCPIAKKIILKTEKEWSEK